MEKAVEWEQEPLIMELTQGKDMAEQLRSHHLDPSLPPEHCQVLLDKIISSYDKLLSMLKWAPSMSQIKPNSQFLESSSSPKSDYTDPAANSKDQFHRDVYKKRKTQPRWTEQVKVCSGTGLDGPLDDGYSWRKYGQKDILGANFPRGYYRCTHRHSQGCLAIKQVQRSDEDPTIVEVTYRGRHTCIQSKASVPKNVPKQIVDSCYQIDQVITEEKPKSINNFGEGLNVKIESMDSGDKNFPSLSLPHPSIGNEDEGNKILATLDTTFISPAASESNLFFMSPCDMEIFGFEVANNLYISESDLTDIFSAHTSAASSPIEDLKITFEDGDFDCIFPSDNSEFSA